LHESVAAGVKLHQPAQVLSISSDSDSGVATLKIRDSVKGSESEISCTRLLFSAGAWTPRVFATLFPDYPRSLPITSLAGHSIVVESPRWNDSLARADCHAVFTTLPGEDFSPEIFSRVGSEIYIAGLNDASIPLPERPEAAVIDTKCVGKLQAVARKLLGTQGVELELGSGEDLKVLRQGLCFRPVTRKGTPIVSKVEERSFGSRGSGVSGGVYVAAGHGPWGISHSLGTGLVMAEMLQGVALSADVSLLSL
jgi:glycine/D-amino acid oxidase-like deaminating enzyme